MKLQPMTTKPLLTILLIFCASAIIAPTAEAANPPPVQFFYVPIPEDQALTSFQITFPGSTACGLSDTPAPTSQNPVTTYLSIAISADDTLIYYDQWEDGGYDVDIANPDNLFNSTGNPSGTQIWGDDDPGNGIPPGFANDSLDAGDVIVLHNDLHTAQPDAIDFDGRDKIAAGKTVAITRVAWAAGTLTRLAGAVEVYDTSKWGTRYEIPVAADMPTNGPNGDRDMFTFTGLSVMAMRDATTVSRDGVAVTQLNTGESVLLVNGLTVGTTIETDEPVQANLLTGQICSLYEGRWFTLLPAEQWSDSYYTPVGTVEDKSTSVFLHNPHGTAVEVAWTTAAGPQTPLTVNAGQTNKVDVPFGSGARFYTQDGDPFVALSAVDSATTTPLTAARPHDWGFSLLPESVLTPQVLVGWGPGRDPTAPFPSGNETTTGRLENSSPIWVTATCDTRVFVDLDGDGDADDVDLNADGDTDDTVGGIGESSTSNGVPLDTLQALRIYDPDGDQTGTIVYSQTDDGDSDCNIAAVWGQDTNASPGAPAIDVGTAVPPLAAFEAAKGANLLVDADASETVTRGDTLRYTIVVRNVSAFPVPAVRLHDTLPTHTSYVSDSARFDDGTDTVTLPDAGATAFPLDEGGAELGVLPVGGEFTVSFDATINPAAPDDVGMLSNTAEVTALGETLRPAVETPLAETPTEPEANAAGDFIWHDLDQDGVQDEGEPGLAGISLNLYNTADGQLVGSTLTDENGRYTFDEGNVLNGLQLATPYRLKLDHEPDYVEGGPLRDMFLTIRDRQNNDVDSDARYDEAGYPFIDFTLDAAGSNASFDVGLYAADCTDDITFELSSDGTEATVSNQSTRNQYVVGLAAYEKHSPSIDDQVLFDFDVIDVGPGEQNVHLEIDLPACAVQIDLFCGPAHTTLDGLRYGDRLLASRHTGGTEFCEAPPAPEPEPATGTIAGVVSTAAGPASDVLVTLVYAGADNNFDATALHAGSGALFSTAADDVVFQTSTDATGYYAFTDLAKGLYLIAIEDGILPEAVPHTQFVEIQSGAMQHSIAFGEAASPTAVTAATSDPDPVRARAFLFPALLLGLTTAVLLLKQRLALRRIV